MDRILIWPGALGLETDQLQQARNTMEGLGWLIRAVFGAGTFVDGLAVSPGTGLTVSVAKGAIYILENLDGTAYSSLPADTTDQIMKQGLMRTAATVSCPAPTTSGQSINYLIEAAFQEVDGNPVLLDYFNVDNPSQAWMGPQNSGNPDNTARQAQCVVQAKAGTAATTGSQTTPSPDSGYVGLAVVTVAQGQSTITSGNISAYNGAPYIGNKLLDSPGQIGPRGAPQNIITASYTIQASDAGRELFHASGTAHTVTIPANASVPFPIGTTIDISNENGGGSLTVAITSDTLRFLPSNVTGSRTVAAAGTMTIKKKTATEWWCTGQNVT